jgi:excisionase family DNA binding protein
VADHGPGARPRAREGQPPKPPEGVAGPDGLPPHVLDAIGGVISAAPPPTEALEQSLRRLLVNLPVPKVVDPVMVAAAKAIVDKLPPISPERAAEIGALLRMPAEWYEARDTLGKAVLKTWPHLPIEVAKQVFELLYDAKVTGRMVLDDAAGKRHRQAKSFVPAPRGPLKDRTGLLEVFTADDVAEALSVGRERVTAEARAGRLKGRKIGNQWRFSAEAVRAYLDGAPAPEPAVDAFPAIRPGRRQARDS